LYAPILLTCQLHTDYTTSANDMLIFEKFSVEFVISTDNNWQLNVLICKVCHTVDTVTSAVVLSAGLHSTGCEIKSGQIQIFF